MIVPVAIKKHMCCFSFFFFFFKASGRLYQMCAVNGVGFFSHLSVCQMPCTAAQRKS